LRVDIIIVVCAILMGVAVVTPLIIRERHEYRRELRRIGQYIPSRESDSYKNSSSSLMEPQVTTCEDDSDPDTDDKQSLL
jgi:hypothetical protein